MKLVILAVLCVVVHATYEPYGATCVEGIANGCSGVPKTPYCRDTADITATPAASSAFKCVECISLADCGPNEFCASIPITGFTGYKDALVGQCVPMGAPLGQPCDFRVTAANVVAGESDKVFCGLIGKFVGASNTPMYAQWIGQCIDGTCYVCDVNSSPYGAAGFSCGTSAAYGRGGSLVPYKYDGYTGNQSTAVQMAALILFCLVLIFILLVVELLSRRIPGLSSGGGGGSSKKVGSGSVAKPERPKSAAPTAADEKKAEAGAS